MVNRNLLIETMAHITLLPELHVQGSLFEETEFGTAACFMGRALLLSGYEPDGPYSATFMGEHIFRPMDEAAKILGLPSGRWAVDLFHPGNTRAKLQDLVDQLLAESEVGSEPVPQ